MSKTTKMAQSQTKQEFAELNGQDQRDLKNEPKSKQSRQKNDVTLKQQQLFSLCVLPWQYKAKQPIVPCEVGSMWYKFVRSARNWRERH